MSLEGGEWFHRGMRLDGGFGSIMFFMVIGMDETRLKTVPKLQAFLAGTDLILCALHGV